MGVLGLLGGQDGMDAWCTRTKSQPARRWLGQAGRADFVTSGEIYILKQNLIGHIRVHPFPDAAITTIRMEDGYDVTYEVLNSGILPGA